MAVVAGAGEAGFHRDAGEGVGAPDRAVAERVLAAAAARIADFAGDGRGFRRTEREAQIFRLDAIA
jgi:hypothetical protein